MTPAAAWRLLAIAPTDDKRAIRSAYAARLKAIDPDADRDGFAALRAARDLALAEADVTTDVADPAEAAPSPGIEVVLACPAPPMGPPALSLEQGGTVSVEQAIEAPWSVADLAPNVRSAGQDDASDVQAGPIWWSPVTAPHAEIQYDPGRPDHALHALLYPDPDAESQDEPMRGDEIDRGIALIDRLNDDAQQGAIDLHARLEEWLSHILAGAWPRSHPLLGHAAALFGWSAREGQIDAPRAIDFINRRLASDRFADAVQQKGHPLHGAWKQLSKPTRVGQGRALWWQGDKINELIGTIRRDYPEVEQRLNWHRIALWEAHNERPIRWWTMAIGAFFALQLIARIATSVYHPNEQKTPVQIGGAGAPLVAVAPRVPGGLGDVEADMEAAVRRALGPDMTIDALRTRAPLVYQLFESNWRTGLDMGRTQAQYVDTMEGLMRERYALLAREAGGEALTALQRHRLSEARLLKGEHWRQCTAMFRRGGLAEASLVPAAKREKLRPDIADLVLAMPGNPNPPDVRGSFTIPGEIVAQVVERSGLGIDQVSDAFRNIGDDRTQCLTQIALLSATLDARAEERAALLPRL
ncbi:MULTISPECIES: hypothetical protein [unclassified Sphingobium]|uniref:hypothetical protein n=1 Tax=unclassified Sphingobium TaxID=2611147 RepID=UPI0035A6D919